MKILSATPIILLVLLSSVVFASAQMSGSINVTGSAEIKVAPDEVWLNVGVETRNATLEPARVENDEKIAAALAFLKQSGVPEKDFKTDYISVQPYYDYDASHPNSFIKPMAYIVRKNIEIRLTKLSEFQSVLTGLLTNGVNIVNGVDFRTTDLRKYRDQARLLAVHAAKDKAKAMVSALDGKLGRATGININEGSGWGGWRQYGFNNNGFNNSGYANQIQNAQISINSSPVSDDSADTFAAGQISVSASVNVSFLIE
jgi:uncharacterized protein